MTTQSAPRSPTAAEVLRMAIAGALEDVHVALPGQITEWNPAQQKASVKPLVKRLVAAEDGSEILEELPIITDVPVMFPRSSQFFFSLPLAPGDFVLLVFCERSIDVWLSGQGDDANPDDFRRHDLSDAVAIPGFFPFSRALADVSATNLAIGKTGGPQIHVDNALVHLGAYPAADFVALAALVQGQLTALKAAIAGAAVVAGDGGAAFKAAILAALTTWPASVAATKAKAT